MDNLALLGKAQDGFGTVLAAVPAERWADRSTCPEWTVRDLAGHAIWGQRQLRAWATGEDYADRSGAPGSPHPAPIAGTDPLTTWRVASAACHAALTPEALARTTSIPGLGEVPVAAVVSLLTTDLVAHTWDIAHTLGADVRLDPGTVEAAFAWAHDHAVRAPGFFGPELTPPPASDDQTRLLAFLGRVAWEPVTV
ncbi:TIGR03086 family metal-binding protein [Amycolatopsis rhabdoformis]|uniref:TIGR03086 family metal-binding protein n=1 Tax=Amycolatopsis rhabdoformis TaxID=1448059 RepID=A0ABZ1IFV6_9PSEU|nr:TIGR03086 family metal-binding protein [Amycolatopsis rhabdoformis]WSE33282.1 TIGR03086 family metal-binding protein [Amycolatopsis rhabdoformis]